MAVANSITEKDYTQVDKQILIAPELAFEIGCLVNATGVTADSNGRKILPAGTPVTHASKNVLLERQTVLSKATAGESGKITAQGILLHDVDVTDGDTNATLVVSGYVDVEKVDTATAALLKALTSEKITVVSGIKN